MMSTEKDFLIEKINTVLKWPQENFVTNFSPDFPAARKGYRPPFSHFELIYSGVLPLTLPDGGEFRELELRNGDVLYLAPNAWVGRGMNTERRLLVVNLHADGIECYFSHRRPEYPEGYFPRVSYFTSKPLEQGGLHVLKSFEYYSAEKNLHLQKQLFKVFLELVKDRIRNDEGVNNSRGYYTYKMILQFMRENSCANINRKTVAYEFGVSPDYITHLFQKHGTASFNNIMQRYRMEKALSFLESKRMNIKQLASLCGFEETSYFIKVFRRFYGVTPLEYRARSARS